VTDSNPFRSEIEQILTDHQRTRFAKVLLGMNRGLTDADMAHEAHADGESIRADRIAGVRRIVLLSLNDELVTAPSGRGTGERLPGVAQLLALTRIESTHHHPLDAASGDRPQREADAAGRCPARREQRGAAREARAAMPGVQ
jgi:hypothetical protein